MGLNIDRQGLPQNQDKLVHIARLEQDPVSVWTHFLVQILDLDIQMMFGLGFCQVGFGQIRTLGSDKIASPITVEFGSYLLNMCCRAFPVTEIDKT